MTFQRLSHDRITWINIVEPTLHEVAALRRMYPSFHPLNLEDVLSTSERPKIDDGDDYVFVVMQFPLWDKTSRLTRPSEIDFFLGRDFLITIHDGKLKPLTELFQHCQQDEDERHALLVGSANHLFYTLLDRLVDYIFPILRKIDLNIRGIEEEIFTDQGADIIRDIAVVRRDIIALRRIIRQQIPILENLEHVDRPLIKEEMDEYFGDILDHLNRARDIIDEDAEIIASLSDTADKLLSHRVNTVIRILTVFSVIMLPLTLLSSVFGMNVEFPIDEQHPDSFLWISFLMVAVAIGMLLYFRHKRWL